VTDRGANVDLNSDLGEGYGRWALGDDAALLEVVTSANVACGFHAGDPATIDRTVRTAVEHGVRVGAQVSYPDLAGFGRREMDVAPDDLTADVLYQLGALEAFARAAGSRVRYVKPHGALYNRIARDPVQAAAVVEAIRRYDPSLPLLTLPGSAAMEAAREAGVAAVAEGFADRAYTAEGRLVSRREPGAVLHDPDRVAARAVRMATEHRVESADGGQVEVQVRSLCVHGDTPGAVDLARRVRAALEEAGVTLEPFA
jgi:5-oxoprolinase (ATP-hydrolysing) subunit A